MAISPNRTFPGGPNGTFSSAQTGTSGQTSQFTETGSWQMSWNYDCQSYGGKSNFIVNVIEPPDDPAFDQPGKRAEHRW